MVTDETILDLFFARSERAIQETDRKYGPVLRRLAGNLLADRRDAEECVSDAYWGAWRAIPPARPSPLLPYLCRITRNQALKIRERQGAARRRGTCAATEELESGLAGADTAETALEARELVRTLEAFLDTLSPENRVIFLGRYWFADSCGDIARRVGLSEKHVSVRLGRLRKKLRSYLTERGICP